MTSWADLVAAEPDFARRVSERLDAYKHKLLATIRIDGAPRISGIELELRDGDLWLAGMPGARKFADLRRDPRLALHSGSADPDPDDPTVWAGDAKLSGLAVEITDPAALAAYAGASTEEMPPGPFELFRVDVREATVVRIGEPADHLLIEHWHQDRGLSTTKRY